MFSKKKKKAVENIFVVKAKLFLIMTNAGVKKYTAKAKKKKKETSYFI